MARTHRSIAAPAEAEIDKIKGSRFLGYALPISSEAEAQGEIARLRAQHHDARHHCYALRISQGGGTFRYSDDGEPTGTGGAPILRMIDGSDVTDVLVVVVRYYGGTKLGTGGLLRAYGSAARAALMAATVVERIITTPLSIRYGYERAGGVKGVLSAHGLTPLSEDFGAEVTTHLAIPEDDVAAVIKALVERTGGQIEILEAAGP